MNFNFNFQKFGGVKSCKIIVEIILQIKQIRSAETVQPTRHWLDQIPTNLLSHNWLHKQTTSSFTLRSNEDNPQWIFDAVSRRYFHVQK